MTIEQVLQAVRSWLKFADTTGTALDDGEVLMAEAAGTGTNAGTAARPATGVYLTVKLIAEVGIGEEEAIPGGTMLAPNWKIRGERRARVSVQAFRDGGGDLLRQARLRLRLPSVQAYLDTLGISISAGGELRDLTRVVDSSFEERAVQEFVIGYTLASSTVDALPVEGVQVTTDLDTLPPGTISQTFTVEVP